MTDPQWITAARIVSDGCLILDPCPICKPPLGNVDHEGCHRMSWDGGFVTCDECGGAGVVVPEWLAVGKASKEYPEHLAGGMVALDTVPGYDPRVTVHRITGYVTCSDPIPVVGGEREEGDDSPVEYPCIALTTSGAYLVEHDQAEGIPLVLDVSAGEYVVQLTELDVRCAECRTTFDGVVVPAIGDPIPDHWSKMP